jgi:glycosyltransferase involved in cell wall biosynthesis
MLAGVRIAGVTLQGMVNSIYRTLLPLQGLAQRGHAVHVEERDDAPSFELLSTFDVVHFCRAYHDGYLQLATALKRAGVPIIWDNDDDLTSIPKENPGYQRVGGIRGQRAWANMTAMMRTAEFVLTPSELLAQRYREASGADVRVIENYPPPTFVRPARVHPHPHVTIGWLGALEHTHDYERLRLREVIERLLAKHPSLEVITIGVNLGLNTPRYRHTPITMYAFLPQHLANFDIGIAPIADIPFNRARSNVKLKEYAACGVPWLASPVGAYVGMGEEQGGRLVPDDRWYEELEALILDRDARRRLAMKGRRWAQTQSIDQHIDRWEQTFEAAIERAGAARAVR